MNVSDYVDGNLQLSASGNLGFFQQVDVVASDIQDFVKDKVAINHGAVVAHLLFQLFFFCLFSVQFGSFSKKLLFVQRNRLTLLLLLVTLNVALEFGKVIGLTSTSGRELV